MANNRMFLVFRPTGDRVYLGKRMGFGWYRVSEKGLEERIVELFNKAEQACLANSEWSQDDFAIALECGDNQPHAISKWKYRRIPMEDNDTLDIDPSVPYGKHEVL